MKLILLFLLSLPLFSQGRQVVLAWTASITPNSTYNAYRASGPCVPVPTAFIKLNASPITGVTYSDNNVAIGTYCYRVTALAGGLESSPSNNAEAPVPPVAPSGLTVNVTVAVNMQINGMTVAQKQVTVTLPEAQ